MVLELTPGSVLGLCAQVSLLAGQGDCIWCQASNSDWSYAKKKHCIHYTISPALHFKFSSYSLGPMLVVSSTESRTFAVIKLFTIGFQVYNISTSNPTTM